MIKRERIEEIEEWQEGYHESLDDHPREMQRTIRKQDGMIKELLQAHDELGELARTARNSLDSIADTIGRWESEEEYYNQHT